MAPFSVCSVDNSRIRSKTAPFSFENGLVWTGPWTEELEFPRETTLMLPQGAGGRGNSRLEV